MDANNAGNIGAPQRDLLSLSPANQDEELKEWDYEKNLGNGD